MKPLLFTFFLLTIGMQCFSQNSDKDRMIADYLYKHLSYAEAIEYYERVVQTSDDWEAIARLADCYYFTHDHVSASQRYSRAVKTPGCSDEVKFHFGNLLMMLERYPEALTLFEEVLINRPTDRRLHNLVESCRGYEDFANEVPRGLLVFQDFNSDHSEFGVAFKQNKLVFTVDSVMKEKTKHKDIDKWTGSSYYHMYSVDCNDSGHCGTELVSIGKKLNKKHHDGPCSFTGDGSIMYFSRSNHGKRMSSSAVASDDDFVNLQLMIATEYDEKKGAYGKIKPFPYNNINYSLAHPAISFDGKHLYFASNMPGGEGGTDIYVSEVNEKGKWTKPENLGKEINTEGNEMFPFITSDSILYISSDGHVGHGGLDIYKCKWDKKTRLFSDPTNMGKPVNSSYDDMSFTITNKGLKFFASERPAPKKGDNIYFFLEYNLHMHLSAIDSSTGEPIPNTEVRMINSIDKRTLHTQDNGELITLLHPQSAYKILVTSPGYDTITTTLSTVGMLKTDTVRKTVALNSLLKINYELLVADANTKKPLKDLQVLFISHSGKLDTIKIENENPLTKELEKEENYHVFASKSGFFGGEHFITTKGIVGSGEVQLTDTIFMNKLQVGAVFKIDDIYYDYDKATIREEAKPSLDVLIKLLNEYPGMTIQINSHTDCRGSYKYNKSLSQKRAQSVVDYLGEKGIDLSRLASKGYGESAPISNCECNSCSDEEHQDNRRTEFKILSMSITQN